jgi:hypothetical protein
MGSTAGKRHIAAWFWSEAQGQLRPTSSPFSRNTDAEAFTWPCVGLAGAKGPVDNTKIFQENIGVFLKTKYPCVHARD